MKLSFSIALKYLFSKKSHNVINIISIISAVGIGIGSLALIIILSVYNGFDNLIKQMYESYEADYLISPKKGKTFLLDSLQITNIKNINGIYAICPIVEENIFIKYGNNQSIATIKGIDSAYQKASNISKNLVEGEFITHLGEIPHAIVGQKLAQDLNLRTRFLTKIELFSPNKNQDISLINPMANLTNINLYPSGIIRLDDSFDKKHIFADLFLTRELLSYAPNETSYLEVFVDKTANKNKIESSLKSIFGDRFSIKDRYKQNETIYKMMKGEKFSVFFILFFVIIIISINIYSSLTMLILEKKEDIQTFLCLGANISLLKRIFLTLGCILSIIGGVTGLIIGLIFCFIQQTTGIIQIPGSYIINSYPVKILFTDILITIGGIFIIGYLISLAATLRLKKYL